MTDFATRSAKLRELRAAGLASVSYEIVIDEPQRVALLELIRAANADTDNAPLEYWVAMLTDLPAHEAETPGMSHGFCL